MTQELKINDLKMSQMSADDLAIMLRHVADVVESNICTDAVIQFEVMYPFSFVRAIINLEGDNTGSDDDAAQILIHSEDKSYDC